MRCFASFGPSELYVEMLNANGLLSPINELSSVKSTAVAYSKYHRFFLRRFDARCLISLRFVFSHVF